MMSARITSGCRVTLVHRSFGMDLDDVGTLIQPPLYERIARPVQISSLVFEALAPAEAAFVDVLVATEDYDVALVTFKEEVYDHRNVVAAFRVTWPRAPHAIFLAQGGVVGIDVALPLLANAMLDAHAPRPSQCVRPRPWYHVYQSMSKVYLVQETREVNDEISHLPLDHETLHLFLGDALSAYLPLETAARMVQKCLTAFG
ncbi:hypothetical protein SDRG_08076 [Saprolegnia diclina VS20]|uniref:Uncharacterized protein n=1 Tax=Saprolegnia diclina (strain VS20) TaxID=1156394 RepID=T0RPA8_SAPDV|nr:hypothetical protein SDRG_08076 [Saprolegnia diclina VS20]EQC34303.1 hypothetical protein SDRG_08076 [Saprolegnia diclina VS20]|eukprot:XP_008612165.1 hypothetical protein SDRG_08076 [Saprolegnia diclina VS20]